MQVYNHNEDDEQPNQGRRDSQIIYSYQSFLWTLIAFIIMLGILIWELSQL